MSLEVIQKIKEIQLTAVFQLPEYKEMLKKLATDIVAGSRKAANEASVVTIFELELFSFMRNVLGITNYPSKEENVVTERHVAKGRIDSKIGAVIIEFKHRTKLSSSTQKNEATAQISDYLLGLNQVEPNNYIGMITDGIICRFVRCESGIIIEEPFENISSNTLDRLIKSIVLLDRTALTSGNLVKDFCEDNEASISGRLVKTLYYQLESNSTEKTKMLFQEWQELFRLAHDDESQQSAIEERRRSLEKVIGESINNNTKEYEVLFALQTAYAIIIKIIAFKVISILRFNISMINFNSLADADNEALRIQMNDLEEGSIFRALGIGNLLEGDFFSWYCTPQQWNSSIASCIKEVFTILKRYEDKALFNNGDQVQDLFKELYIRMMPDKVRHSLGEFYTPSWLADYVLEESILQLGEKDNWRGLDPCAGSGTFLTVMIGRVLDEIGDIPNSEKLSIILNRVKGIDLNPLAVLTARINYFINIAHLITEDDVLEIPVYLGDASYVPEKIVLDNVHCFKYRINTLKEPIDIIIPQSAVKNTLMFSRTMTEIEKEIKNQDETAVFQKLISIVDLDDRTDQVKAKLKELSEKLVSLEKRDWNGIWARIITNFLTTANLGKFDIIVGNPPWIDWKNLPEGYREKIKSICVSRHLFSGDARTGGINLDICALISNVSAQNWLSDNGVLAFLMPQKIMFQQSYEGFRNLIMENGGKLFFQRITDWTKAGHPFSPVTEKFLTYFIQKKKSDYRNGIKVTAYKIKRGKSLQSVKHISKFADVKDYFEVNEYVLGQCDNNSTKFTCASNSTELKRFNIITGESSYIGREGIEFYPQELFLLKPETSIKPPNRNSIYVRNYQSTRSKHKVNEFVEPLETKFLHPLIKGINIERFHITEPEFIVPFPYEKSTPKIPISMDKLRKTAPLLTRFFEKYKSVILAQTNYNERIINDSNAEYYALARVGEYSYANIHVAFRDNTKWQAAVVTEINTTWGGMKRPLFQNHAVSICQRSDGTFITEDEAHYICAILNAPITGKYIMSSSDSRSYKIRPPVKIPLYDSNNPVHKKLSLLSKRAHENYNNRVIMREIDKELDLLYLKMLES